ncbi:MAG: hypothetical protein K8S23_05605 [Candidatus Cloacimonetes bacterium]|nr:hypothetical protein [Candidatus Cloacimonadota bacterium]
MPLQNQKGSSILENIIALAIFSSVILILSTFFYRFMLKNDLSITLEAQILAQTKMEMYLIEKVNLSENYSENRWKIVKKVSTDNGRSIISIKIYFKEEVSPRASLNTIQLS